MLLSIRLSPHLLLTITVYLFSTLTYSQSDKRKEYIQKYKDIAVSQMKKYGVPASITLAQGCLESFDGNSRIAREANNHFGIKCHDWTGEKILHDDNERNECFRKYPNVLASYEDHSKFLRERSRYGFLFSLPLHDYKGWAEGLQRAGYATNPSYSRQLIKIIEDYELSRIDLLLDSAQYKEPVQPYVKTTDSEELPYKIIAGRVTLNINGVACIIAMAGESYGEIAKEFSLFKNELLNFNDLKEETPVEEGTLIFLQKKNRIHKGPEREHLAGEGETMRDISQKYCIRLKQLIKLNPRLSEKEPEPGSIIKLK